MKSNLGNFPVYDRMTNTLNINDLYYTAVSSQTKNFFTSFTASCGATTAREILTLNPKSSVVLNEHFNRILELITNHEILLKAHLSEDVILQTVVEYVRGKIFPTHSQLTLIQQVAAFIEAKKTDASIIQIDVNGERVPCIPVDEFISSGLGVCRHHAMVTAYILDGLTKYRSSISNKPFLFGVVQVIRDGVPGGAHAWVTYVNSQRRMHIDTLWNLITEFSTSEGQKTLGQVYGVDTIERQLKKTDLR